MTRLFVLVGVLGICGGVTFTNAWAVPTPTFYTSLNDDASITSTGGVVEDTSRDYVAGVTGNAFRSTSTTLNGGGWARWDDGDVGTIFNTWTDSNGITIDHYFRGTWNTDSFPTGTTNEGLWAIVRRNNTEPPATGNDQYIFTSIQSTTAKPGKLRVAFANNADNQYKFTFNDTAASGQEKVANQDLLLNDNVTYHLTMSIGNGEMKLWLDDVGGEQYSNAAPVYTYTLPGGYYWTLPPTGDISSTGTMAGRQRREMDIGIRGFGNTGNTVNNFGGTLRTGHWIDEVNIYNGVYSPADLVPGGPVLGDYNGNGFVDSADYILWRKGVQPLPNGEVATVGTTDPQDYVEWQSRFGNPTPGGGGEALNSGAVPEPSMVALVACACFVFAMRRSHSISGRRLRSV